MPGVTDAATGNVLFISHNAVDRPNALALEQTILALVGNTLIDVRYSTSDGADPEGGEAWREWICHHVADALTTLIVVTPHALGKPWLLWEAGAVKGAALARSAMQTTIARRTRGKTPNPPPAPIIVSLAYGCQTANAPIRCAANRSSRVPI